MQHRQRRPRRSAPATRRSATRRPGRSRGGQPSCARSRQRQPDHPAGRHPRHHQPVPVPADRRRLLRPVHRRRARHGHRRPRVHPRHHQPDGRRPRRGPDLRAGRRRWASRGATWSPAEYQFEHGYANGGNIWAVGAYATGNTRDGHPRLRHRRQPAQLLRLRLRHHRCPRCTPTARSGTARMWEVRQALVDAVRRARTPTRDAALQLQVRAGDAGRQRPTPAGRLPGQPPLGPADVRLVPAPAGRDVHARRPRRDARRRPDALRRRQPGRCCGKAFARRGMGDDASVTRTTTTSRCRASPRPAPATRR